MSILVQAHTGTVRVGRAQKPPHSVLTLLCIDCLTVPEPGSVQSLQPVSQTCLPILLDLSHPHPNTLQRYLGATIRGINWLWVIWRIMQLNLEGLIHLGTFLITFPTSDKLLSKGTVWVGFCPCHPQNMITSMLAPEYSALTPGWSWSLDQWWTVSSGGFNCTSPVAVPAIAD